MFGEGELQGGGVRQPDGRLEGLVQVLDSGAVRGNESWRVQLKRQAVGLGHVALGGLHVAERVIGRLFGSLGQVQGLRQLAIR